MSNPIYDQTLKDLDVGDPLAGDTATDKLYRENSTRLKESLAALKRVALSPKQKEKTRGQAAG